MFCLHTNLETTESISKQIRPKTKSLAHWMDIPNFFLALASSKQCCEMNGNFVSLRERQKSTNVKMGSKKRLIRKTSSFHELFMNKSSNSQETHFFLKFMSTENSLEQRIVAQEHCILTISGDLCRIYKV